MAVQAGDFGPLAALLTENVLSILRNGPDEVGINAGGDEYLADNQKLSSNGDIIDRLCAINIPSGAHEDLICAAYALAIYLFSGPARISAEAMTSLAPPKAPASFGETLKKINPQHGVNGVLLLFATKVNFWAMNHHTGRSFSEASGYTARVMDKLKIPSTNEANVRTVWMMGHWGDTRKILAHMNCSGVNAGPGRLPGWPAIMNDISLRTSSNPAGTAYWVNCYTIMSIFRATPYHIVVPRNIWVEHARLGKDLKQAEKEWARFHIGARFLTSEPRLMLKSMSEAYTSTARTYAAIFLPSHTLNKSASLNKANKDESLSTILAGVKSKMKESVAQADLVKVQLGAEYQTPAPNEDDEEIEAVPSFISNATTI